MWQWHIAMILGGLLMTNSGFAQQSWFNFRTQTFDTRESAPATDEEARDYIQQWPETQGLYRIYRQQGFSVLEAIEKVLRAVIDASDARPEGGRGQ